MVNPKLPLTKEQIEQIKRETQEGNAYQPYTPPSDTAKKNGFWNYILMIGIPVVVVFVMAYMQVLPNYPSVKQFNDKLNAFNTTLQTTIASANTAVAGIDTKISDGIKSAVAGFQTQMNTSNNNINNVQTQVNNMVGAIKSASDTASAVDNKANSALQTANGFSNSINSLTSELATDEAMIKSLTDALAASVARIKTLEDNVVTPTTTPTNPITFVVNTLGNLPVQVQVIANTTQVCNGSWQMIVTNNTNKPVNNLVIGAGIMGYASSGSNYTTYITSSTTPQLVSNGGSVLWSLYQTNVQGLYFVSGWGYGVSQLSIPANSSLTLWVSLQVSITTPVGVTLNTQLILQPFVQSYNQ